jgi:hypothetical protein
MSGILQFVVLVSIVLLAVLMSVPMSYIPLVISGILLVVFLLNIILLAVQMGVFLISVAMLNVVVQTKL